jgi:hypothetical protein
MKNQQSISIVVEFVLPSSRSAAIYLRSVVVNVCDWVQKVFEHRTKTECYLPSSRFLPMYDIFYYILHIFYFLVWKCVFQIPNSTIKPADEAPRLQTSPRIWPIAGRSMSQRLELLLCKNSGGTSTTPLEGRPPRLPMFQP